MFLSGGRKFLRQTYMDRRADRSMDLHGGLMMTPDCRIGTGRQVFGGGGAFELVAYRNLHVGPSWEGSSDRWVSDGLSSRGRIVRGRRS
jgi:hypothetical protein